MEKIIPFSNKIFDRVKKIDRESLERRTKDLFDAVKLCENILNQITDGVVIISEDLKAHYLNRQAMAWLNSPSITAGDRALKMVIEDTALLKFIERHVRNLKTTVTENIRVRTPKETSFKVQLHPLENNFVALILTEQVTPDDSEYFRSQEKRMEALLRLTAGIAHEIGNPLAAIDIHLNLLKRELNKTEPAIKRGIAQAVEVIHDETKRLDKIIRNFLKATRNPPLRFKPEDINVLIEEALLFIQPELESHGIELKLKLDKSIPPFFLDRERLHQVFLNLIKNALAAMDKTKKIISISSVKKQNLVLLSVRDNGCGIPESSLPHIFDAYYTTKENGSGLGLMAVYNAVREHGGKINASSRVGKGTTFQIELPIRLPHLQLPMYPVSK